MLHVKMLVISEPPSCEAPRQPTIYTTQNIFQQLELPSSGDVYFCKIT